MKKIILILCLSFTAQAKIGKSNLSPSLTNKLAIEFKKNLNKIERSKLKGRILELKGKSVPALVRVMKNDSFPDKNRWMATFLLGQIMGKKSAVFISKFSKHPNWIMRMASLKTLLALKQKKFSKVYGSLLNDSSMLVRYQALDNIKKLDIKKLAPNVWSMLYDKKNYHISKTKTKKRSHIIRSVIRTVGDLKFEKAKKSLLSMIQKKKYKDIHVDIDYALSKITGKKSPTDESQKKRFWKKIQISNMTI